MRRVRPGDRGPRAEQALGEIAYVQGLCNIEGQPIKLEGYQAAFMACQARRRCIEKARQTGYSWVFAAEAIARAHLRESNTAIFVSYNLEDAKEKIRYVKMLAESLPDGFRKKMVEDSKTAVAFADPNSGNTSRILSLPSKAPRGKGGDLYLDEFAHYMDDETVYAGSTALIARHPMAQFTVCSTPRGRRGVFWSIAQQETEKKYEGWFRQRVPWWLSRHYCSRVPRTDEEADAVEAMSTDERIERFGLRAIIEQYDALLLEDFQQEFECAYVDEAHSFYSWALINSCTKDTPLYADADGWDVKGRLTAGYDVGRKRDRSSLVIEEEIDGHKWIRYVNAWSRRPFEEQKLTLFECMDALPIASMRIDCNGIGMQLAEEVTSRYGENRVESVTFTQQSKELMATDLKIDMERKDITLPRHRDLLTEMHSIRKTTGAGGKPMFDSEKNAKHHGDIYWATAMANKKDRGPKREAPVRFVARVIG